MKISHKLIAVLNSQQIQIQESSDSETVKDSVQCIRDSVVESVKSLILESCNHANHATQVRHDCCSGSFQMAGTTVSGRFHCDACGKRQTTS